jgi:Bacterial PH domain
VSFESEFLLGRFRARGSRLVLPTALLGLSAFLLAFFYARVDATQAWQSFLLYGACGAIALFGFVIPTLRYLTAWTDITTSRVVARSGLWGQHYRSVSLADVQRVELATGVVSLHLVAEEPLELRGLPKPKLVSQELSNLVARLRPASQI